MTNKKHPPKGHIKRTGLFIHEIGDPDEHIHGIRRVRFVANFFSTAIQTILFFTAIAFFIDWARYG